MITPRGSRARTARWRLPCPSASISLAPSSCERHHRLSRLASGAFRPVLDRTFPLEDIVEAYRYVESGQKVGNVVITVRAQ